MKTFKKWLKAKENMERAKAVEMDLRKKLGDSLITGEETRTSFLDGENKVAITKKTGYSVPSASIKRLRKKLGEETFQELFYTNYSLREGSYKKLSEKKRKLVDKFVKIYEAPYQITISER